MCNLKQPQNVIELIHSLKQKGIPKEDYSSYVNKYLEYKARTKCIPLSGTFELTPFCNLDCKMCYVHVDKLRMDQCKLLPPNVWKTLMLDAFKLGMRHASLTGGECLTYPYFDELYLYLCSLGISPGVLTNGILLDNSKVQFFKKHPPRLIQVSVYGSSDDAYENVTGHRAFKVVYDNIQRLIKEGLPLKIAITPNRFMVDDMEPLLKMVEELGIPYSINRGLIPPRKNTGRPIYDLTIEQYIKLYRIRSELKHVEIHPRELEELPDENRKINKQLGLLCGSGRSTFCINSDGSMGPCLALEEIKAYPLKNGFKEAWRQINEQVAAYVRPQECNECIYYDRCIHCVAMHKGSGEAGHCDPAICERTKRLIAAGYVQLPEKK